MDTGSPLNRVSFLRPDHTFLSQAFRHPSTTFVLFQNLEPLTKSSSQLAYSKLADVQPITGDDPFSVTEEDTIAQYNSSLYLPQIIFLGLDERIKDGFNYKDRYIGQPWFAVDVTPKESVKEAAEKLIARVEGEGLEFSKGRMNLNLPPESGTSMLSVASRVTYWSFGGILMCLLNSCHLCRSPPPARLERKEPLLRFLRL